MSPAIFFIFFITSANVRKIVRSIAAPSVSSLIVLFRLSKRLPSAAQASSAPPPPSLSLSPSPLSSSPLPRHPSPHGILSPLNPPVSLVPPPPRSWSRRVPVRNGQTPPPPPLTSCDRLSLWEQSMVPSDSPTGAVVRRMDRIVFTWFILMSLDGSSS